jgi:hypothetical protein
MSSTALLGPSATRHGNEVTVSQNRAFRDAAGRRERDRVYWEAVSVYVKLLEKGYTNLPKPDINELYYNKRYLDPAFVAAIEMEGGYHGSALSEEVSLEAEDEETLTYDSLPEWERDLLDGYERIRLCPGTLVRYHISGFYELCQEIVDAAKAKDLIDESAPRAERTAQMWSIQDRLDMIGRTLHRRVLWNGLERPTSRSLHEMHRDN